MSTTILYLLSGSLSLLGNAVLAVALPLIVLERTGSAAAAGTLALAVAVPTVLASLLGGVVVDRVDRRLASIVSDVISASSVALLAIVDLLTGLNLGWFIAIGILGALGDAPGMAAREALLPAIVRASGQSVERLVSLRESASALVIVVGPGLAGILIATFEGTTVLWLTAATSLAAALLTAVLPRAIAAREPAPERGRSGRELLREAATGFTYLLRDRFLGSLTVLNLFIVAVLGALQGILLPVVFVARGQPAQLGTVLSALAIGLILGSVGYTVLQGRLPVRVWFRGAIIVVGAGLVAISLLPAYGWILAAAVILGIAAGPVNAILGAAEVRATPEAMRGRIVSTQTALATAVAPLMIFAIGLAISQSSVTFAGYLLIGLAIAGVGWALVAAAFRSLPQPQPTTNGSQGVAPPAT